MKSRVAFSLQSLPKTIALTTDCIALLMTRSSYLWPESHSSQITPARRYNTITTKSGLSNTSTSIRVKGGTDGPKQYIGSLPTMTLRPETVVSILKMKHRKHLEANLHSSPVPENNLDATLPRTITSFRISHLRAQCSTPTTRSLRSSNMSLDLAKLGGWSSAAVV